MAPAMSVAPAMVKSLFFDTDILLSLDLSPAYEEYQLCRLGRV
jgi:hypothetical protein